MTAAQSHSDSHLQSEESPPVKGISRRSFLLGSATGATVVGGAALAGCTNAEQHATAKDASVSAASVAAAREPFDGAHQSGIATSAQAHLTVIALNVRAGVNKVGVQRLLKLWTEDARRLTQGENPLGSLEPEMVTKPARLTITCGVGKRFFSIIGKEDQRPAWLQPLPAFSKDKLDPRWGESDIVIQIACDDPVTMAFATRHMIRSGTDYTETLWVQKGFLNANGANEKGETPRNLFGQKDGTVNPHNDQEFDAQVWIDKADDSPAWLHGGSCMIVRRIAMNLDTWEILDRESREIVIGRDLKDGAPLSGGSEFDAADFHAVDEYGLPKIDPRSHMALATPPSDSPDQKIQRRAYSYDEAPIPGSGQLSNVGLVFCCFQKDPRKQFIPIQQRLNDSDRLNEWITHIGSAVYAILPGTSEDSGSKKHYWGAELFES
ncbi:Dyp-type peroxidase [Corynebacterium ulcerans]|uniref:Iron-dependent peroxidase n=2 Tax=Corynebacterium ulcerans TaxID=65058 RepID=A0ABD0BM61_CORUL|nr:Dyp-type peroxidase [Corynebacterium ulcerans]AEG84009.1 putative secreted protein [Corynebacterium ulcerans BR-AD22]AIU30593.1 Dyp-type peroxidase family protein [Corynebacterium ulcerans]AIU91892.1 Dyp-type peroxidase family protein [Corynebacterium ulcerans]AKN77185.1 Dyp-type peroxidase family protein [Corynebacterium ulcerans FRC58]KPH75256.1 peroxidase [Corynebacterium ulcerans]